MFIIFTEMNKYRKPFASSRSPHITAVLNRRFGRLSVSSLRE